MPPLQAERDCLDILNRQPGHREALWALSRMRLAENKPVSLEALVGRMVALNPDDSRATQDLALRLMQRGESAGALLHARNAVRMAPLDPQSHVALAMVLTDALKPHAAGFHYARALTLSGRRDPILLANFALCLRLQGRMAEGRALYAESHAAAPAEIEVLLDWARLEEADHRIGRAAELLDRAALLRPDHPALPPLRATLLGREGHLAAALAVTDGATLTGEQMLERGRLLDRAGRYDDAFAAFDTGRAMMRAAGRPQYAAATAAGLAARLKSFFTAARIAHLPRATTRIDVPQPVFVVGFPRSGTTLVEHILTATPSIAAGGELPLLWEVTAAMPRLLDSPLSYPEALADLWLGDRSDGLESLRDHYLRRASRFGISPEPGLFTDKMPLNETHLGLIALLFPDAPSIQVVRHPLDVVLSVYSNNLTHGFHCSAALETAARHYALIDGLIEHYRCETAMNIVRIRYEDLVRNPEPTIRSMLDFVGVPFAAAHLRAHENRRHAATASYAQVIEPLHARSLDRWQRYRAWLEPIVPILLPAIERLGYRVD